MDRRGARQPIMTDQPQTTLSYDYHGYGCGHQPCICERPSFDDQADAVEAAIRIFGGKQDEWRLASEKALLAAAWSLRALARNANQKRGRIPSASSEPTRTCAACSAGSGELTPGWRGDDGHAAQCCHCNDGGCSDYLPHNPRPWRAGPGALRQASPVKRQ